MSNPYDSPQSNFSIEPSGRPQGAQGIESIGRTSFVGQVTIVAILMILHGLIVYFNTDVARAFELVKQGYTPAQVKDAALGMDV